MLTWIDDQFNLW